MLIGGQEWQDEDAYYSFMEDQKNRSNEQPISKVEQLEQDLDKLAKAIRDKEASFEMTLRVAESQIIAPGSVALVSTGITKSMLDEYSAAVELLRTLSSTSWLKVAPYLVSRAGVSCLEIRNLCQLIIAKEEHYHGRMYATGHCSVNGTDVYLQQISRVDESNANHHVAYAIEEGDPIATMRIQRR